MLPRRLHTACSRNSERPCSHALAVSEARVPRRCSEGGGAAGAHLVLRYGIQVRREAVVLAEARRRLVGLVLDDLGDLMHNGVRRHRRGGAGGIRRERLAVQHCLEAHGTGVGDEGGMAERREVAQVL